VRCRSLRYEDAEIPGRGAHRPKDVEVERANRECQTADSLKADTGSGVEPTPYQELRGKARLKRTATFSEYGKLGVTAIANSPAEARELYDRTLAVLDIETRFGRTRAAKEQPI
jgi:hypothetical protein